MITFIHLRVEGGDDVLWSCFGRGSIRIACSHQILVGPVLCKCREGAQHRKDEKKSLIQWSSFILSRARYSTIFMKERMKSLRSSSLSACMAVFLRSIEA
jgi:hypothetical protein